MERIEYCINEALALKREKKKEERNDWRLALVDQAKIRASFTVLLGFCSRMVIYIRVLSPLFFHRREISDEIRMNTRSSKGGEGARYRGRRAKHRETRYSKILTREIYTYVWNFFSVRGSYEHGSASTFHFSAREGNLYPCRRNGILIIGMQKRGKKKKKKNFFIKFLIFLTSASFSGFFLTILFHDREQNSSFRIMKIINYARKVSFLLHVEIII